MSLSFMPKSIGGKARSFDFGADLRLLEEFRPRTFNDVLGNGHIVDAMRDLTAAPRPTALLFDGPTGLGKSSLAECLANELGIHPTTGFHVIESGESDIQALDRLTDDFRFLPFGGGWRLVLIEEADWMIRAPKVYTRWLSILDHIPAQTVIVFTTNAAEKFTDRFLDRCERFTFGADYGTLAQDAQLLIARIWAEKIGRGAPPRVAELGIEREGLLSFRRVVGALEPLIRDALRNGPSKPLAPPAPTMVRCAECKRLLPPRSLNGDRKCLHCALGSAKQSA